MKTRTALTLHSARRETIDTTAHTTGITACGASYAETIVHADAACVHVALERQMEDGSTWLNITGSGISEDHGMLKLQSPDAARSLAAALLELMANPHGAEIFASAKPDGGDE